MAYDSFLAETTVRHGQFAAMHDRNVARRDTAIAKGDRETAAMYDSYVRADQVSMELYDPRNFR